MNTVSSSHFPTFGKAARAISGFIRSVPRKCLALLRWFRRLLFSKTSFKTYLVIATLICLAYTTLRWIGRRAWQAENERVAAAGMAVNWKALATPILRDEDNFLAAPVFEGSFTEDLYLRVNSSFQSEELAMWLGKRTWATPRKKGTNRATLRPPYNGTLADYCDYFRLTGMLPTPPAGNTPAEEVIADQRWQSTIQAIYAAAARPAAQFPHSHDSGLTVRPGPRFASGLLFAFNKSTQLYAEAQLEMNNLPEVLPALRVTDHLVRAYTADPDYISVLQAVSVIRTGDALLRAGMKLHRWPGAFLERLLQTNYPQLIQQAARRSIQRERAYECGRLQNFPESFFGYPRGDDPAYQSPFFKVLVPDYLPMQAAVRTSQHYERLFQASAPLAVNESWRNRLESLTSAPILNLGPKQIFGYNTGRLGAAQELIFWHIQLIIRVTPQHLAIALELHYLTHNRYPAALEELNAASAAASLPLKDIDGNTIRYLTDAAGTYFTLISVGPDGLLNSPADYPDDIVFSTDPQPKKN